MSATSTRTALGRLRRNAATQLRLLREIEELKLKITSKSSEQNDIKEKCERWTMPRGKLFNADREIGVLQQWFDQRSALGLSRAEIDKDRAQVKARMDQIRKYEREVRLCDERVATLDEQIREIDAAIQPKAEEVGRLMEVYHSVATSLIGGWMP